MWYQGTVSTDDLLWRIENGSGSVALAANPPVTARVSLDATQFTVSPDEQYALFINKTDDTLWLLTL